MHAVKVHVATVNYKSICNAMKFCKVSYYSATRHKASIDIHTYTLMVIHAESYVQTQL